MEFKQLMKFFLQNKITMSIRHIEQQIILVFLGGNISCDYARL